MIPFAVPLFSQQAAGPPPPPPPPPFSVGAGTYISSVAGASGSALGFIAYPANGTPP